MRSIDTASNWEIEFVPDDPQVEGTGNFEFHGTYDEARDYADRIHPDYLCKEIVFHKGP